MYLYKVVLDWKRYPMLQVYYDGEPVFKFDCYFLMFCKNQFRSF